jgi:hypothetical protein
MSTSPDAGAVRIPVEGLLEEFTCPICLMPITDCYMCVPPPPGALLGHNWGLFFATHPWRDLRERLLPLPSPVNHSFCAPSNP